MIEFLLQHYGLVMLALTAGTLVVSCIMLFRMGGKPIHETPHLDPSVRSQQGKDTASKAVTRFHKGARPNKEIEIAATNTATPTLILTGAPVPIARNSPQLLPAPLASMATAQGPGPEFYDLTDGKASSEKEAK